MDQTSGSGIILARTGRRQGLNNRATILRSENFIEPARGRCDTGRRFTPSTPTVAGRLGTALWGGIESTDRHSRHRLRQAIAVLSRADQGSRPHELFQTAKSWRGDSDVAGDLVQARTMPVSFVSPSRSLNSTRFAPRCGCRCATSSGGSA
jgi:hypothetical protein